ncbi:DNA-processing protein DprA [uncultured Tessaracoccus sp.]|uniref:DNA-processing protein DprA n=1 Tax=uncultured Tessaracoccus sp. TaxID=905023 RepID=UPI0026320AC9|nr:DNA-processing protein DprA [uncultured Tessaracoccus sp.]
MATVADQVRDERTARIMLSMIVDPDDPMTGKVVHWVGGRETLRLLESDLRVPTLGETEAEVWRSRFAPHLNLGVLATADAYQQRGMNTLTPSDDHWPKSLSDLGPRQTYLLWTKGATSLLSGSLSDRVTITGMRATTSYDEVVASDLASRLSDEERVIASGGAYGIEGAAHRGTLASGGHAVVVMGNGIDIRHLSMQTTMLNTIGDVGLLASEVPPATPPTRHNLLARHRIMAALSGATVMVEAPARSRHATSSTRPLPLGDGWVRCPARSPAQQAMDPTTCCGKGQHRW